ncbi:unnamed protein product [Cuscuta epithymum]|uniref:Uncharacterized protein n=1 Tax=Cuscuta epithymum TaxID=186058 RepID=A0AAV0D7K7_9ASTE|nr:unnamed protein product [Cuscuta epithymum]
MTSTVPAKSQPLHNFALPHLKWKKNHHSNNHHRGRSAKHSEFPCRFASPLRQYQSPLLQNFQSPNGESMASTLMRQSPMQEPDRRSPMRGGDRTPGKLEKKQHKGSEMDVPGQKEGKSKLVLKLPRKSKSDEIEDVTKGDEGQEVGKLAVDQDEGSQKIWNLRPRKPIHKSLNLNGVQFKAGGPSAMTVVATQSPSSIRPDAELNSPEKKKEKKRRFSIALSKEEIEEDIFALTGMKPAKRPKKRTKSVQKQLDTLFPGLWLASITPDSYKVSENPPKG